MDEPTPIRPWWRKTRWRLALAAWLLLPVLYLASEGPGLYLAKSGWLPERAFRTAMRPIAFVEPWMPAAVNELRSRWILWWRMRLPLPEITPPYPRPDLPE